MEQLRIEGVTLASVRASGGHAKGYFDIVLTRAGLRPLPMPPRALPMPPGA